MGLFSGLLSKKEKKRYCLFCGEKLTGETCQACGRQDKPLVPLSALNWSKVPVEAVDAVPGKSRELSTVKEMAASGELCIADIYVDRAFFGEDDDDDDSFFLLNTDFDVYVQFSTPDLAPCDEECQLAAVDFARVEELLKSGRHDAKILWGCKKKSNYYYAFVPQSDDVAAMLDKDLLENLILFGGSTQGRSRP